MKYIHLVPQYHGLFYMDDINLLLEITYRMFTAVYYSWSFGSNKFECQAAEYIFLSEVVPGATTSLDHLSTLQTIFLFPFSNISGKILLVDAQINSLQKPISFGKTYNSTRDITFS